VKVERLVLLHSPLVGVVSWGALPGALERGGVRVLAVAVDGDDRAPFAQRYVRGAVGGVVDAVAAGGPVVLVGHSGAGPLLGAVGRGLRERGRVVAGYLFCDAGLPRPGASRLDLLAEEDPELAAAFRAELERGGRFPTWSYGELAAVVPNPTARAALLRSLRPRGLEFFAEALPAAPGWPDAPCGYLRLSAAYDGWAAEAVGHGWPTAGIDAGHFHALVDPGGVAAALLGLLARM
jgi:thioesterase domain-containing protein